MLLKIYKIEYENIWKANNPNDELLIQMFSVEINDFMLTCFLFTHLASPCLRAENGF